MKFLPLILRNLLRRKVRTIFTILSIVIAFLLFGVLMAIRAAFSMGVDIAGADRLMVIHKVSIIQPLPQSYGPKIRATPGVTDITHANWFGGYYQDPSNFMANMAVDPESWLRMYPEFELPEEQKKAWLANRTGAIVGDRHRQEVRLEGRRPRAADLADLPQAGRLAVGLHDRRDLRLDEEGRRQDAVLLPLRLHERDAARREGRLQPTSSAGTCSGSRIRPPPISSRSGSTRCSRTRPPRPRPRPRRRSSSELAKQVGDIGAIMIAITAVVMGFILFVAGNAMAQSIRERTNELGVLKTLGFTRRPDPGDRAARIAARSRSSAAASACGWPG